MDFDLDEDLHEVAGLAREIFTDAGDLARVVAAEREHDGFDADLWHTLGSADLIGLALPQEVGGSGLGMLGAVIVLEEQGRRLTPVPLWAVLTQAAWPIAEAGTPGQQQRWLPGILDGSSLVTGSFDLDHAGSPTVRLDGDRLSGELTVVPGAAQAAAFVLPINTGSGIRVALVPANREGVGIATLETTSRESAATVSFTRTPVTEEDLLGEDGAILTARSRIRGRIALAALAGGLTHEAVAITAAYTSQRVQFDRPLSTNQAVTQRAVDAWLDAERIGLTARQAAWIHDTTGPDSAEVPSLVTKWWADTGGFRAVSATQHLHGGIGADIDYPIHRYYLWGRQLFFTLGSAGAVEAELGDLLSHADPIGAPA